MAIGNFGSLIRFRVSDNRVLTFKNLQKTVKGRWGTLTPVTESRSVISKDLTWTGLLWKSIWTRRSE